MFAVKALLSKAVSPLLQQSFPLVLVCGSAGKLPVCAIVKLLDSPRLEVFLVNRPA